jgi:ectoine hydroxylase-related dioxygenase (phytanoyl-CoA dioxygenase family)
METAFARLPAALREGPAPVPAPVRAGQCVFHHCLTVHGSHGNPSPRPRRAVALAFLHPDTRSLSGERPVIPGGPRIAAGAPIAGPLFPEVGGGA